MARARSGRLSAPLYFACVALLTVAGVGVAMAFRPAFRHDVLQGAGLERVPVAAADSFYAVRVAPLFAAHCTSCHGAVRAKGALRLDSFAAVMGGGKHGAVIAPGDARASELFTRITLPMTDDRAMPPSGKQPLSKDEVTVIRLWIAAGASGSLRSIKGAPKPVIEVRMPVADLRAVEQQRQALAPALARLQARYPGVIAYQSRTSADLEIDASLVGAGFDDADLAALSPLAARIVRADLSGAAVTDASAAMLARMTALKTLRLGNTKITDAAIPALAGLKSLRSLAVTGTAVSDAALAGFRRRGVTVYGGGDAR